MGLWLVSTRMEMLILYEKFDTLSASEKYPSSSPVCEQGSCERFLVENIETDSFTNSNYI